MNLKTAFKRKKKGDAARQLEPSDYLYLLEDRAGWGDPANERALRVAAVYACVDIIASAMAGLPLEVKADGGETDTTHPAAELLAKPNGWLTGYQFRKTMTAHLCLRGNAYARIIRTSRGMVRSLVPIEPNKVRVKRNADGSRAYELNGGQTAADTVQQRDMFHLMNLSLDGLCGLSVLHIARQAYETSRSAEDFAHSLYRSKLHPGGLLLMPEGKKLTKGEYKRLADNWSASRGPDKQHKTMILEDGTDFKPLTMTAQDSQFLESRRFQRSEIAMFFGVPLFMIGETEKVTSWGAGIEQQNLGFVDHTLKKYVDIWEAELDALFGARVVHNMDDLIRGDTKTRWDAHVQAVQWGILSPNEVRAIENRPPRDGGDTYYDPPNTAGGQNENDDD